MYKKVDVLITKAELRRETFTFYTCFLFLGSPDYVGGAWYGSPNGGGSPALRKYHVATRFD